MEIFRINFAFHTVLKASGKPARWNSKGVDIIYTAASRSLACLENVVHRNRKGLSQNFICLVVYVPDDLNTEQVSISSLPAVWSNIDYISNNSVCSQIGDKWTAGNSSAVLRVPSAIIKNEFNYLLNPKHPDYQKIQVIDIEPFSFDLRLK